MPKRVCAVSRKDMAMLSVAMPKPTQRRLVALSKRTGMTVNELVRRAVAEWLERAASARRKEVS